MGKSVYCSNKACINWYMTFFTFWNVGSVDYETSSKVTLLALGIGKKGVLIRNKL